MSEAAQAAPITRAGARPPAEFFSPWLRGAAVLWLLLVVVVGQSLQGKVSDPDLWWHLRTGELILTTGEVPHTDPYSYSAAGRPWVAHEWLSEALLQSVVRAWGFGGLVWFRALMLVLIAAVMYAVLRRRSGSFAVAVFLSVGAMLGTKPFWSERPHLFTYLFFALLLWMLDLAWSGRSRWLWAVPPLMLFWVNLHGGYAAAFILLGAAFVGGCVDGWTGGRGEAEFGERAESGTPPPAGRGSVLLTLLAVIALGLLAAACNPKGPEILLYPLRYAAEKGLTDYVSEWATPNVKEAYGRVFEVLLLGLVALAISTRARWRWRDAVPLLLFGHLALTAVRHVPLYAQVAVTCLAGAWPQLGSRLERLLAEGRFTRRMWRRFERERARPAAGVESPSSRFVAAGLVAAGLFLCWRMAPKENSFQALVKAGDVPIESAAWLKANVAPGPVFNDYDFGGYLIWALPAPWKVYVDGRADVYGGKMMQEYMRQAVNAGPHWQDLLDRKYRADVVFWAQGLPLAQVLAARPHEWQRAYENKRERVVIFVRNRAAAAERTGRTEARLTQGPPP